MIRILLLFVLAAAAVWVAHYGNTDPGLMNTLAVVFVALRVLYVAAYLADLNPWRTVIWMAGMFCVIGLFLSPLL